MLLGGRFVAAREGKPDAVAGVDMEYEGRMIDHMVSRHFAEKKEQDDRKEMRRGARSTADEVPTAPPVRGDW